MGKKTLTNAHCLLDLIEKAPTSILKLFSALAECRALALGFDWTRDDESLRPALIEHVKHLRKEQRDPAEREALRVLRLASARGAAILSAVAQQFHDAELQDTFSRQDGGEIGRAVWMRTHSDEALRLFDGPGAQRRHATYHHQDPDGGHRMPVAGQSVHDKGFTLAQLFGQGARDPRMATQSRGST